MIPHRPTIAEIDLDALEFNYRQLREKVDKNIKILAVVKADGYGHGATFISKELQRLGTDLLGVAICEEGIALRKAGIIIPVVVLNGIFKDQIRETIEYNLTPVVYDSDIAQMLSAECKRIDKGIKVHVKIDTGMGRVGILPADIRPFFSRLEKMGNLEIEGALSHLSTAGGDTSEDRDFFSLQLERFEECLEEIDALGFSCPLRHISNSAAIIDSMYSSCNLLRPGLMLYGAYPSSRFVEKISLQPVMSLKTEIIQIKKVPSGTNISYGRSFITERDSIIATLPIGYADGYSRLLSNRGEVLIGGEKAHVVGSVCMDMTMVDITETPDIQVGDEAVLMGRQGENVILADDLAEKTGTISYEVFCRVSKRVPRIYIKDGEIIGRKYR